MNQVTVDLNTKFCLGESVCYFMCLQNDIERIQKKQFQIFIFNFLFLDAQTSKPAKIEVNLNELAKFLGNKITNSDEKNNWIRQIEELKYKDYYTPVEGTHFPLFDYIEYDASTNTVRMRISKKIFKYDECDSCRLIRFFNFYEFASLKTVFAERLYFASARYMFDAYPFSILKKMLGFERSNSDFIRSVLLPAEKEVAEKTSFKPSLRFIKEKNGEWSKVRILKKYNPSLRKVAENKNRSITVNII